MVFAKNVKTLQVSSRCFQSTMELAMLNSDCGKSSSIEIKKRQDESLIVQDKINLG